MRVIIEPDYGKMSKWAADYVANRIIEAKPTAEKPFKLGCPTGSSPLGLYKELIKKHKAGELSFANVITFNMDEYVNLDQNHPESYHSFMWNNFFSHIDIKPENVHILDGNAPVDDPEALRRNTLVTATGDVIVQIIPGWELLDDFNYPVNAAKGTVSQHAATLAPAYLLIPGAEPAVVTATVDARAIAPTVARQMHIRSPNGASQAPLHVSMRK